VAILRIFRYPSAVLTKTSAPIEHVGDEERALLDNMLETMYLNQGVGLAAPQVGVSSRAIVVDVGDGPICLVNPVIVKRSGRETGQEGCLSLPETMVEIRRALRITYKGLDRQGKRIEIDAEGLLARAIQHEIDHLDGRLIIDYANPVRKILLKRRLIQGSRKKVS